MADCKTRSAENASNKWKAREKLNGSKSGRRKRANSKKAKTDLYGPHPKFRGQGNIKISRKMTQEIMPKRMSLTGWGINDVYRFMDKLAFTHKNTKQFGDIQIINYGFGTVDEPLYCVMDRIHGTRNYEWNMRDKLFTAREILDDDQFAVKEFKALPRSIVDDVKECIDVNKMKVLQALKAEIAAWLNVNADLDAETIFDRTPWCRLPVFTRMNYFVPKKKGCLKKRQLLVNKEEFLESLKDYARDHCDNIELIPIMRFDPEKKSTEYWIEFIWIVKIDEFMDIGISFIMNNDGDNVKVKGIHCDKDNIINHHQLCLPDHNCQCLDSFNSIFDEIRIGNIDGIQNKLKAKEKENLCLKKQLKELQRKLELEEKGKEQEVDKPDSNQVSVPVFNVNYLYVPLGIPCGHYQLYGNYSNGPLYIIPLVPSLQYIVPSNSKNGNLYPNLQ